MAENTVVCAATKAAQIYLGRVGENLARSVTFNLAPWIRDYGEGTPALLAVRDGDTDPYPVSLVVDGSNATWNITASDTAMAGYGTAELRWYVGAVLAKSVIYDTYTADSLSAGSATPPQQDWVDEVLAAGVAAQEAAEKARESAEEAATSASEAEGAVESARVQADDARESAAQAEQSLANAQDAQAGAEAAQGLAESAQLAAEAAAESSSGSANDASGFADAAAGSASDAADSATAAAGSVAAAESSAEESEAWAVGTKDGVAVPSTDPQYENNAKYWAAQAEQAAESAGTAVFGAYPVKTVTGNPAVITDGADGLPVKALSVEVPAGAETVTIQTLNENIFRDATADWQNGYFYNNAGQKEANSVYACTDGYFPVVPNAVYTAQMVKGTSATTSFGIIFYDADKNFLSRAFPISGAATGARAGVFTSVPNAYFIRINVPYSVSAPTTNIQILQGDHGTTYNPATDIVQPTTIASYDIPDGFAGGVLDVTNGTLTETGGTPQAVEAHDLDTDLGYNCILVNTGTVTVNYRRDPSLVADFLESYLLAVEQRLSAAIVAAGN